MVGALDRAGHNSSLLRECSITGAVRLLRISSVRARITDVGARLRDDGKAVAKRYRHLTIWGFTIPRRN